MRNRFSRLNACCVTGLIVLCFITMAGLPCVAWADDIAESSAESPARDSAVAESDEVADASELPEGAEYDKATGLVANSERFTNGYFTGYPSSGESRLRTTDFITWSKDSDGAIVFSNGIDTSGAMGVGIDVSVWNGSINWGRVKSSGVDFAIIRCGYGGNYTSQDDTQFLANVRGCQANDIPFGIYLYSYATINEVQSEIDHVLRLLDEAGLEPDDLALPVYYDLEQETNGVPSAGSNSQVLAVATAFCNGIEAEGYEAGVYSNLNWWTRFLTSPTYNNWDRWIAQYNITCDYTGDYSIWQCSSRGYVYGISGAVDMNLSYREFVDGERIVTDSEGTKFQYDDGTWAASTWVEYNGNRYYFGPDGYALLGEQWIESKLFYFDSDGVQVTGWHTWSDGRRSYFSTSLEGAAAKGWWTLGGSRYYFDSNRRACQYDCIISGKLYYFDSNGAQVTGWHTWSDGRRSYFSPKHGGAAAKGWWTISGSRYYFSYEDNRALVGRQTIGGKLYYFESNGAIKYGWHTWSDGTRSYFARDIKGAAAKGWWTLSGVRYYFSSSGILVRTGE